MVLRWSVWSCSSERRTVYSCYRHSRKWERTTCRIVTSHRILYSNWYTALSDHKPNMANETVCRTQILLSLLQQETVVLESESISMDDLKRKVSAGEPYFTISTGSLQQQICLGRVSWGGDDDIGIWVVSVLRLLKHCHQENHEPLR